ncbi:hypothetical protein F441_13902 [Phytophthora nicotianae CJ01A1]|uniref:M96 mating-specific protein family n=6 Tax=Phytophthora nicotianae TaxID=4792 RepID=W2PD50_PHYN3|nr:hypothetical protein PPTG_19274 [Phytophthora nicotianae INRA-310]ETI40703.1 hypothetical protein F443_13976 [Phytophthora nicotianae P1569]ETK80810.1 hypothetical protein L915_13612 [Phytophthora nicotianae]ETO69403.1 hypothetical protein F444_14004 [Phytophthora nicotianae P1976]ETP10470.1 hypothetical protein F441_13902 [Phytophthora nicotianae CJ01A1]ETP38625.1 hypothetical protein F442_13810 [Phytophthora nicotianae P10297]
METTSSSDIFLMDMDEVSVLEFLADIEMPNDDVIGTTESSPKGVVEADTPSKPEKKSWRQRRKEELLALRRIAKELSIQHQQVKLAAGVRSTLPGADTFIGATAPLSSRKMESSQMWEKTAIRQSVLRQSSEEENVKLREAVAHNLQLARSLQRAIKRKLREDMVASSIDLKREHRLTSRGIAPPRNNSAVFGELLAGMDRIYADMDIFLKRVGMHEVACPGRRNNTITRRAEGLFVEFLDKYAVPFALRQTEKAIWTATDRSEDATVLFVQNFTPDNNTRMRSVCCAYSLGGFDFRIVMRDVFRKYVEQDRVVFIRRTLIEPVHGLASVTFIETNRLVIQRGKVSTLGPTTMMQTHREAKIREDISSVDLSGYPSLDVGVETWESKITCFNNSVEDRLVRGITG